MLEVTKDSHLDHGLTPSHVEWLVSHFKNRNEFFISTQELPAGFGLLKSGLYGPLAGDPPVEESEVRYAVRGARKCASRTVKRPKRSTPFVTVIAGPHGDRPCVLYTAYGGWAAPREPGDPTLKNWDELMEARAFWAAHALAEEPQPMWVRTDEDVDQFVDHVNNTEGFVPDKTTLDVVAHALKHAIREVAPGRRA